MSPEVLQNSNFDERSDIWALGILLYELYHNKEPYTPRTKGSKSSMFNAITRTKLKYQPQCPDSAQKLIERILQVKREDRPSLAQIMEDQFFRVSGNYSAQCIEAGTPSQRIDSSVDHGYQGRQGFSSTMRNKLTSESHELRKINLNSKLREGHSSQSNLIESRSVLSPKSPNIMQSFNMKMQYQKDQAPLSAQIMISPKAMNAQILSSTLKGSQLTNKDATPTTPQYFSNFSNAVTNTHQAREKPLVVFSRNVAGDNFRERPSAQMQINLDRSPTQQLNYSQKDTRVVQSSVDLRTQVEPIRIISQPKDQRLMTEHAVNDMHLTSNGMRNYQNQSVEQVEGSFGAKKVSSLQGSQINLSRLNIHRANLLTTLQTINKAPYSPGRQV